MPATGGVRIPVQVKPTLESDCHVTSTLAWASKTPCLACVWREVEVSGADLLCWRVSLEPVLRVRTVLLTLLSRTCQLGEAQLLPMSREDWQAPGSLGIAGLPKECQEFVGNWSGSRLAVGQPVG